MYILGGSGIGIKGKIGWGAATKQRGLLSCLSMVKGRDRIYISGEDLSAGYCRKGGPGVPGGLYQGALLVGRHELRRVVRNFWVQRGYPGTMCLHPILNLVSKRCMNIRTVVRYGGCGLSLSDPQKKFAAVFVEEMRNVRVGKDGSV